MKRSYAALETTKVTTFAELAICMAIRGSRNRPRTVADGCDRKRNVKRTHPQLRDPQSETGTLATHSGIRRITTMSTPSHSIHHGRFLQARNPHTLASRDQNCSTTMWLLEVLWLLNNCTQHNKQKCSENIF